MSTLVPPFPPELPDRPNGFTGLRRRLIELDTRLAAWNAAVDKHFQSLLSFTSAPRGATQPRAGTTSPARSDEGSVGSDWFTQPQR